MSVLFPPTAGELEGVEAASSLVYCADQLGTVETPGNGTYTGMPINCAYHAYCSQGVGTAGPARDQLVFASPESVFD